MSKNPQSFSILPALVKSVPDNDTVCHPKNTCSDSRNYRQAPQSRSAATHGLSMQRFIATVPIKVAMHAPCTVILVKESMPFQQLAEVEVDATVDG